MTHEHSCAGQEKISAEILSQWCLEAKQHASLRAMRKLMKVSIASLQAFAFQALPLPPIHTLSLSELPLCSNGTLITERRLQAFRVACHYGDTETEMDSSLRSTSTVVFNRLVIFVLKEADQIFRQLLGVSKDAELASGAVKRQPR